MPRPEFYPAEGCQLVITRPNGTVLVQGMPRVADLWGWVKRLQAVIPADAIWQVVPMGHKTPWDAGKS